MNNTYTQDWAKYEIIKAIEWFYRINLFGSLPANPELIRTGFEIASNKFARSGNMDAYQAINNIFQTQKP